jgi:hypothetical protein
MTQGLRATGPGCWVMTGARVCSCQSRLLRIRSQHVVKDDVGDSGDGHRGDYFERG